MILNLSLPAVLKVLINNGMACNPRLLSELEESVVKFTMVDRLRTSFIEWLD